VLGSYFTLCNHPPVGTDALPILGVAQVP
jgi:hypothetical protein